MTSLQTYLPSLFTASSRQNCLPTTTSLCSIRSQENSSQTAKRTNTVVKGFARISSCKENTCKSMNYRYPHSFHSSSNHELSQHRPTNDSIRRGISRKKEDLAEVACPFMGFWQRVRFQWMRRGRLYVLTSSYFFSISYPHLGLSWAMSVSYSNILLSCPPCNRIQILIYPKKIHRIYDPGEEKQQV